MGRVFPPPMKQSTGAFRLFLATARDFRHGQPHREVTAIISEAARKNGAAQYKPIKPYLARVEKARAGAYLMPRVDRRAISPLHAEVATGNAQHFT
jgi:hypothetical protein